MLALDLPRFMEASDRDKADTLLKTIGVGEQLTALDQRIKSLYDKRTAVGQIAQQKKAYAEEMLSYPEAPPSRSARWNLSNSSRKFYCATPRTSASVTAWPK